MYVFFSTYAMFNLLFRKDWSHWAEFRAYVCTFTITFAFSNIWKVPREGFRFGGVSYGVLVTAALVLVGLPAAFLQLSIGQLSQQDPVGLWRAVPFFKGLGYLRLMISYLACTYTVLYIALSAAYFLHTLGSGIPFPECMYYLPSGNKASLNATECLEETYMAPFELKPEYYTALALTAVVIWIIFPFLLFSPTKFMKRIFYVLGPVVVVLMIAIFIYVGDRSNLIYFQNEEWGQLLDPYIWHAAITQSLLSTHTAGGYLISLGDTVYHNVNVRRSAIVIVVTNIVSVWFSLLFWFSINSGTEKYNSPVAVIVQTYETAQGDGFSTVFSLLTFAMLFLSGVITMLILLFPLYDRFRRRGGARWRLLCFTSSLVGALATLAILLKGLSGFLSIEDVVLPFLISVTTMAEVSAFIFIYGWKLVMEDIEFLTSSQLEKYWSYSLRSVAFLILPIWVWWVADTVSSSGSWSQPPWPQTALTAAAGTSLLMVGGVAVAVVIKQSHFDIIAKLKSSFRPSRHWGPRDPITHHYWLARREESQRQNTSESGIGGQQPDADVWVQSTGNVSKDISGTKFRSNSDDWVYTIYRKGYIQDNIFDFVKKSRRSKSLDVNLIPSVASQPQVRDVGDDIISYTSGDSKT